MEALKISPGAVKLQDLTRERQIEFGRKRANKVPCQRRYRIRSHSAAHKLGRHDRDSASHSSSIDTLIVDDSGTDETILYIACMTAISSAEGWPRGSAIRCDTRPTTTAPPHPFGKKGPDRLGTAHTSGAV